MRFLVRLLGGIWLATLLVSAGFAYLEVREDRARLVEDLKRRAALVGYTVSQASENLVARGGNKNALERVLARFGRPDRPIAIYDVFGSVEVLRVEQHRRGADWLLVLLERQDVYPRQAAGDGLESRHLHVLEIGRAHV